MTRRHLKIVYVAPFLRPWGTESHIAKELEALGHTVRRIRESTATLGLIESRCRGADLLLYTRMIPLPVEAAELWRQIEANGTVTASYHLDLYRGLARAETITWDAFWRTGTVFTADGDPGSAAWFAEHGVNHVWMPAAVYGPEAVEAAPRAGVPPVVFVGATKGYPHEWPWRQELVTRLADRYGDRFGVFEGWRGNRLNSLYASCTVAVGDSLCPVWDGRRHERYWSDRVYETTGRGGFLIFPNVPGIDAHFDDRVHLWLYEYGDFDALAGMIDWHLDRPDQARAIARAGQAHTRAHHTYRHRLEETLTILDLA